MRAGREGVYNGKIMAAAARWGSGVRKQDSNPILLM